MALLSHRERLTYRLIACLSHIVGLTVLLDDSQVALVKQAIDEHRESEDQQHVHEFLNAFETFLMLELATSDQVHSPGD